MSAYRDWLSLREIDAQAGVAKGAAFRAFKGVSGELAEGLDYVVLHHARDREIIAALQSAQRLYASSVNVLLLAPSAAQRVASMLRTGFSDAR